MNVKVTKRAERRIEIVDRFWRNNRLDAPGVLKEELAAAEARLRGDLRLTRRKRLVLSERRNGPE